MPRLAGIAGGDAPERRRALATAMLERIGEAVALAEVGPAALAAGDGCLRHEEEGFALVVDGTIDDPDALPGDPGRPVGVRLAAALRGPEGAAVLGRLDGDFVVTWAEASDGVVRLARDPFGVRSLYYAERGGSLAWASRPAALFVLPSCRPVPRRRAVAAFAAANYRFFDNEEGESPYEGVRQLPPGHLLTWRPGEPATIAAIAPFGPEPEWEAPIEELAPRYAGLFREAVARRLKRARRPAFTLSGGLDSSSVVTTARALLGSDVTAVSTVYDRRAYDESREIRDVLDTGGIDWVAVEVAPDDLFAEIAGLVAVHDEPVPTVTWLAHARLCREIAARGHDVLFGGLGGDEQHAGEYDYFFYRFADIAATGDRALLDHEIDCWQRHHDHPVHRKTQEVAEAMRLVLTDPARRGACRANRRLLERYRDVLAPGYFDLDGLAIEPPAVLPSYLASHTLNELFRNTMPCCLRASDRNAHAAGVGTAHPFLSGPLLRFMLRVPGSMKIRDGVTKWLLRQAMRGTLPEATRTRIEKTGWNAPAHEWFAGPCFEPLMDLVRSRRFRERGIYDPDRLEALIREHRAIVESGAVRDNHMMLLWQVVNLDAWLAHVEDLAALRRPT